MAHQRDKCHHPEESSILISHWPAPTLTIPILNNSDQHIHKDLHHCTRNPNCK